MQIEIKENQIIIQFSEKETAFIVHKVGSADLENITKHIKGKLVKALSLEDQESKTVLSVGRDFNLNKIKKVTAELNKRNNKTTEAGTLADHPKTELLQAPLLIDKDLNFDGVKDAHQGDEDIDYIKEEIGDELLAELLDHNLLKSGQKPKKEPES